MIVDALQLLGENRFGATVEVAAALELADDCGVDTIVAAPARPMGYHLEPANEWLAEQARGSGGRIAVLGRVDPRNGDSAVAEARRCLDELGCVGLFVHPAEEVFSVTAAAAVAEVAAAADVPLVVATGYPSLSEPLQVAELAQQFPDLTIVMTSGGQINISGLSMVDAWLALRAHAGLHVLTNGEYRQDFIENLATQLDASRVLFGSFAPAFDAGFERKRVAYARLTPAARLAVEGDNAARLFRLANAG